MRPTVVHKHRKRVDPQYLMFLPYYGRHGQDRYVHKEFFFDKKDGVFVDIGAYDGVESSNTLFFEESLGWKGICVEPLPEAFSRCTYHRSCLCINACASDRHGMAEFLHIKPNKPSPRSDGQRVSNFEKLSGLTEYLSSEQLEIIHNVLDSQGGTMEHLSIQCLPINDILRQLSSTHVDLLTIDTEGSELAILKAIDFDAFDIDVIVVEVHRRPTAVLGGIGDKAMFTDCQQPQRPPSTIMLSTLMDQHGYRFVKELGYDWIYRKL